MNPMFFYIGFGLIVLAVIIGSGLYARRIHAQLDSINEKLDVAAYVVDALIWEYKTARAEAKKYKKLAHDADRERLDVLKERDELREIVDHHQMKTEAAP